jgi:hypothetical protein
MAQTIQMLCLRGTIWPYRCTIKIRYVDALSMFEPVLKKMLRILPLDHPYTLKTMIGVANALNRLKRHDEAMKMYEDAVPKLIRVNGEDRRGFATMVLCQHVFEGVSRGGQNLGSIEGRFGWSLERTLEVMEQRSLSACLRAPFKVVNRLAERSKSVGPRGRAFRG